MGDLLDGLLSCKVGDKIYTTANYGSRLIIKTITGETKANWIVITKHDVTETKTVVRKSDGYVIGSSSGGRWSTSTHYHLVNEMVLQKYRIQCLYDRLSRLKETKIVITNENFDDISGALKILYSHELKEKGQSKG